MYVLPEINGFLAGGKRLVHLQGPEYSAWLEYARFGIANPKLAKDIADAGLPLFQQEDLENIVAQVAALDHFAEIPAAHHVGWNGSFFAQHDGTISGAGVENVYVLFEPKPERTSAAGTLHEWKRQVAIPVSKQPLAAFAMMTMFLPPLLSLMPGVRNPVFEFVGARNSGKSSMLKLAGSAVGSLAYGRPLRDLQLRFDQVIAEDREYPSVLNDVGRCLLTTTTKPRQAELFGLAAYDLPGASGGRVVLMASQEPLRSACSIPAGQDDIITLMLKPGANVFSNTPEGVSAAKYSDDLLAQAAAQHGTAYPAFITALTSALAQDETAVKVALAKYQARFAAKIDRTIAGNNDHHVVRAIGAAYAAGRLAVKFGILPQSFKASSAALLACTLFSQGQRIPISFRDRLENLIADGAVVHLNAASQSDTQAEAVNAALGSVSLKPSGRIIRVWYSKIYEAFHDWASIKGTDEVRAFLQRDGNNLATWGHMAPGLARSRDFQFKLPTVVEGSLFDGVEEPPAT